MNRPDMVVSESHGLVLRECERKLRISCEAIAARRPGHGWTTGYEREGISALNRGPANGTFRHRTFGVHDRRLKVRIRASTSRQGASDNAAIKADASVAACIPARMASVRIVDDSDADSGLP